MAASRRGPTSPRTKSRAATSLEASSQSVADAIRALAGSDPIQAGNWGAWKAALYSGEIVRILSLGTAYESRYHRLLPLLQDLHSAIDVIASLPTDATIAYHRANAAAVLVNGRYHASFFEAAIFAANQLLRCTQSAAEGLTQAAEFLVGVVDVDIINRLSAVDLSKSELDRLAIELEKEWLRIEADLPADPEWPNGGQIGANLEGLGQDHFAVLAAIREETDDFKNTPTQLDVSSRLQVDEKTLRKLYRSLEQRNLIAPPEGKKNGRILTALGRRALQRHGSP